MTVLEPTGVPVTAHTKLRELLREPEEPFRHMAPSAPLTAPLGLCVCSYNIAPGGATNGSPTWARLITGPPLINSPHLVIINERPLGSYNFSWGGGAYPR